MSLLKAAGVVRHRKALDGIAEEVSKDLLRLVRLRLKHVDWPDWVPASLAEFDEEHLSTDESVWFATLFFNIGAARPLRPRIRLFLDFTRNLHVSGIVDRENTLQGHCEAIPSQDCVV